MIAECSTCFYDFIAKCNDVITVYAKLEPLKTYRWIITDKFGHKFQGNINTDSDGFWEIPVSDLPPGLLTEFSGHFELEVQDNACKPIKFKVAQEYDCINFRVRGGTFVKDTLGCSFDCVTTIGSETLLIPFTNDPSVTITWTTQLQEAYGNNPSIQVYHQVDVDTYQLVNVAIQQVFTAGVLTEINIDNGGPATGYVLIS